MDDPPMDALLTQFEAEGPVAATFQWINLVFAGDLRAAWPATDPVLRLALAQSWLHMNRGESVAPCDLDEAADSLAGLSFSHSLWRDFESDTLAELCGSWPPDLLTYGAGGTPRPVPPDAELVLLIDTAGEVRLFTQPTLVTANPFLLRCTADGWLMLAFSDQPPTPGWPPTFPQLSPPA